MKLHVVGAAAVVAVMCSAVVNAQSLKERQYFASQDKDLADEASFVNKTCGTNIAVKLDWSKPPTPEQQGNYSASGYCEFALSGMRRVCEHSPEGKDAVKQKIKTFTCGFGPQRTIALKEGVVDYKINFNSSNDDDFVFEYLQNNL